MRAVALAVRDLLTRLRDVLGDAPYNVVINTPPPDDARPFHWWIDVTPRLTVTAGFEAATGSERLHRRAGRGRRRAVGGPVTVTVSVVINAPPSEVWAVIEPIETHVEWMADAESITFTSEQHRGVGTTFECLTRIGPFHTNDRMIVTEWERGSGDGHRAPRPLHGHRPLRPRTGGSGADALHLDGGDPLPVVDGRVDRRARGAQPILQRVSGAPTSNASRTS